MYRKSNSPLPYDAILPGTRFGKLQVVSNLGSGIFDCDCDCGDHVDVHHEGLESGQIWGCRKCQPSETQAQGDQPDPRLPKAGNGGSMLLLVSNSTLQPDGCWAWSSWPKKFQGTNTWALHGRITVCGVSRSAHNFSYSAFVGMIPCGKFVIHHCGNNSCVNPDHLFLGSQKDTAFELVLERRAAWAARSIKQEGGAE